MITTKLPKTIQSVERMFDILMAFSENRPIWRVTELASELDLHPSTVSRMLNTAKKYGIVEQDQRTGEYRLGFRLLSFSQVIMADLNLVRIASPILSCLAAETQENAFLSILDGIDALTIAQVVGPRLLTVRPTVGYRQAPSCTSSGKVLLAYGPLDNVEAVMKRGLPRLTAKSIIDQAMFRSELKIIRARGYGIADEEQEEGLVAVGAPVFGFDHQVIAAVSTSGSSRRMQGERMRRIIDLTCEAGNKISSAMGSIGHMERIRE